MRARPVSTTFHMVRLQQQHRCRLTLIENQSLRANGSWAFFLRPFFEDLLKRLFLCGGTRGQQLAGF